MNLNASFIAPIAVILAGCSASLDSSPEAQDDVAEAQEALVAKGAHVFTKQLGEAATDQQSASVAVDLERNIILAGRLEGTIDFGGGPLTAADDPHVFGDGDMYLAKLDRNGNHIFSKHFGASADTVDVASVAVDVLGRIHVTGAFAGTLDLGGGPLNSDPSTPRTSFFAVFDGHGHHLRSMTFGGHVSTNSVAVDLQGRVYLGASYDGTVNLGDGARTCAAPCESDGLVIQLDKHGHVGWTRALGNTEGNGYALVRANPLGRTVFSGELGQVFDYMAGSVHTKVVVGSLSSDGAELWRHTFPVPNSGVFSAVAAIGLDGDVTLGVSVMETVNLGGADLVASSPFPGFDFDLALAHYDRHGQHAWSRIIGQGDDWQLVTDVQEDALGNIVFSGAAGGSTDFGGGHVTEGAPFLGSAFVAKAGPGGDVLWVTGAAQAGYDSSMVLGTAVTWSGEVVSAGYFSGGLSFPGGPQIVNQGFSNDLFLTKLTY